MKFFFGIVGAGLGAMAAGAFGALIGAGLGVLLAFLLQDKDAATPPDAADLRARPDASPLPSRVSAAAGTASPATQRSLEARVAALESQVATLRAQVLRLSGMSAGETLPTSEAIVPDAPQAAMAAARVPDSPAEVLTVPAPPMPETIELRLAQEALPSATPAQPPEVIAATPSPVDEGAQAPAAEPAAPDASPQPALPPVATVRRVAPEPKPTLKEILPPTLSRLIFGGNTIVKVGVLILFLGLAFLLRYAAERVTVPVELRYAGVALLGAVLLAIGWRLRDRKDAYGLILQGAGIGVFYLTTLSALKISQLLPPGLAFAFLLAVTVLSAVLAVLQNAPLLAYVAAAEGFAAPVLVSTGSGNHIALFSYLAVLNIGIVLMAWFKAWRPLNVIGAVGTFTLATAWASRHYTDEVYASTQAFLLLFFVMFTVIGVLFARRALALGDEPDAGVTLAQRATHTLATVGRVDSTLAFGVPLAAFGLQYLMVRGWEYGPAWAALGFSAFYLLLGALLLRGGPPRYALLGEAYVVVSVIFGTLAIPLALEGQWTGATWAIEAAGMFWLGVRQQRPYARAFALLVLAGATARLVSALRIDLTAGTPLVDGSVLSLVLLATGALAMAFTGRHAGLDRSQGWERSGAMLQLAIGISAVAALPWMLLTPGWACVVTSGLALACALLQTRAAMPAMPGIIGALHALALLGFASTLHTIEGAAMLQNGWQGLVRAVLIGASLLASAWLPMAATLRAAEAAHTEPRWSAGGILGLMAGIALLSLSLLFVMPADVAARIWPWFGVLALWLALRLAHPALAVAWLALQLGSGVAFVLFGPALWSAQTTGLTLWTPLVLALAGGLSGDMLRRAAAPSQNGPAWCQDATVPAIIVAWMLAWWSQVLPPEIWRHLVRTEPGWTGPWATVLIGWIAATSVLVTAVARWRDWRVLGQSAWATVPLWIGVALVTAHSAGPAPHHHFGWLVWPTALVWHTLLLRALPRWCSDAALRPLHVLGFWLFVVLAAVEGQWWTTAWGDAGSAWSTLGWVLVPAVVLFGIVRERMLRAWPVRAFPSTYLVVACAPVAVYLAVWLWVSNTQSGAAAPLAYIPLLNPLEVGHGLAMLAIVGWLRALPEAARVPKPALLWALGATAFGLYTGMVLRTCHHWADVPWDAGALFASKPTQASLSVAWSIVGVSLMMLGHKRVRREVWIAGAGLLAVVVLKLFFVELADRGGLSRIVSFIVVGLLLLAVGYFAPVPPNRKETSDAA